MTPDKRINPILRRLVATGNLAALVASDPARFSAVERQNAVQAWDASVAALRETNIRKEPACCKAP